MSYIPQTTLRKRLPIRSVARSRLIGQLDASIELLAFWAGIMLPVVYLPVLAGGLGNLTEFGMSLGLIALHLLALIVGHEHQAEAAPAHQN